MRKQTQRVKRSQVDAPFEPPHETPKVYTATVEVTPNHVIGSCLAGECYFRVSRPHRNSQYDVAQVCDDLRDHRHLHRATHREKFRVDLRYVDGATVK